MTAQITTGPETFTFPSNVDEAPIFLRKWTPREGGAPRAAVQITHGIAEHSGRYDRFARFLPAARASWCTPSTCVAMARLRASATSDRPA